MEDTEREAVRKMFNEVAKAQRNGDEKAKWELLREYFTNPDFKRAFEEYVWGINNTKEVGRG